MEDIKISELRYLSLANHEQEAEKLFEAIVRYFYNQFYKLNPNREKDFISQETKKLLEEYINTNLKEVGAEINDQHDISIVSSRPMYWAYKNSKIVNVK